MKVNVATVATQMKEAVIKGLLDELNFLYHYMVLRTPIESNWYYSRDRRNEISFIKLYDEQGIETARFCAESRILSISGNQSSSQYYVEEGIGVYKIEKMILKYFKREKTPNPFLGEGFVPIRYERIFDEIEAPVILDKELYGWHIRDEQVWLQGPGHKVICKLSLDGTQYKFLKNDWKEIAHADEMSFRRYIERCVSWGRKEA